MISFKKILIGVDNSSFADHAARIGFEMARKFESHVGLVHIIEPSVAPAPVTDSTFGMPMQSGTDIANMEIMDMQNQISDNVLLRTEKKYGDGLTVTHFTDYGSTADGIINCSKEFDANLVILGTHSRSGIDRFFMGSIAEEVVRNSEVPVLVVPSEEKAQ